MLQSQPTTGTNWSTSGAEAVGLLQCSSCSGLFKTGQLEWSRAARETRLPHRMSTLTASPRRSASSLAASWTVSLSDCEHPGRWPLFCNDNLPLPASLVRGGNGMGRQTSARGLDAGRDPDRGLPRFSGPSGGGGKTAAACPLRRSPPHSRRVSKCLEAS